MADELVYNGSAGIFNDTIDQGATWSLEVQYLDDNDDPIDLTGYTAAMQLRTDYQVEPANLTLTTSNGGITITGPTGTILITATATQTYNLASGIYVYDLELSSGAFKERVIQGMLTVSGEVTNV